MNTVQKLCRRRGCDRPPGPRGLCERHDPRPARPNAAPPGSRAAIYDLANAGRIRVYPNGTQVRVIESRSARKLVEVIEGEDRGQSGWVQVEFVRMDP